jgi:hypothetical protein
VRNGCGTSIGCRAGASSAGAPVENVGAVRAAGRVSNQLGSAGRPALIHRSPLPIATGCPQFGPIRTSFFWRLGLWPRF